MTETARRQAAAIAGHADTRDARVVAKGYGDLAEQVIAEARRHGIYVHESPELVALLMRLDLDARIPESWYAVVAEILAWAAELDSGEQARRTASPV